MVAVKLQVRWRDRQIHTSLFRSVALASHCTFSAPWQLTPPWPSTYLAASHPVSCLLLVSWLAWWYLTGTRPRRLYQGINKIHPLRTKQSQVPCSRHASRGVWWRLAKKWRWMSQVCRLRSNQLQAWKVEPKRLQFHWWNLKEVWILHSGGHDCNATAAFWLICYFIYLPAGVLCKLGVEDAGVYVCQCVRSV